MPPPLNLEEEYLNKSLWIIRVIKRSILKYVKL